MSSTELLKLLSSIPLNDLGENIDLRFNYSEVLNDTRLKVLFHTIGLNPVHNKKTQGQPLSYMFQGYSLDESKTFQFVCTLTLDTSSKNPDAEPTLKALNIEFLSPLQVRNKDSKLGVFIDQCCKQCNVLSALNTIDSYAKLYLKRSEMLATIDKLYGKDPVLTTWPYGPIYAFPSTKPAGKTYQYFGDRFKFILKWEIEVRPLGNDSVAQVSSSIKGSVVPVYSRSFGGIGKRIKQNRAMQSQIDYYSDLSEEDIDYIEGFSLAFKEVIRNNGLLKAIEFAHDTCYKNI